MIPLWILPLFYRRDQVLLRFALTGQETLLDILTNSYPLTLSNWPRLRAVRIYELRRTFFLVGKSKWLKIKRPTSHTSNQLLRLFFCVLIILLILLYNSTVNTSNLVFSLRVSQYFTPLSDNCHAFFVPNHNYLQPVYINQSADAWDFLTTKTQRTQRGERNSFCSLCLCGWKKI